MHYSDIISKLSIIKVLPGAPQNLSSALLEEHMGKELVDTLRRSLRKRLMVLKEEAVVAATATGID